MNDRWSSYTKHEFMTNKWGGFRSSSLAQCTIFHIFLWDGKHHLRPRRFIPVQSVPEQLANLTKCSAHCGGAAEGSSHKGGQVREGSPRGDFGVLATVRHWWVISLVLLAQKSKQIVSFLLEVTNRAIEQAKKDNSTTVESIHVQKILPQALLDF